MAFFLLRKLCELFETPPPTTQPARERHRLAVRQRALLKLTQQERDALNI